MMRDPSYIVAEVLFLLVLIGLAYLMWIAQGWPS